MNPARLFNSPVGVLQSINCRFYFFAMIILFLLACEPKEKSDNEPGSKPNIIYILADDLGYGDLSITGQKHFSTPNIDRLAKEGLVFTQHYAGSTVCAPSRSALMTGLHTGHTPIRGNKEVRPEGQHPLPSESVTMAEILKSSGYTTGAFGKWGLGFPGSVGDPLNQGFDRFYGYNCQRIGHNYYPYHLWSNEEKVMLPANAGDQEGAYAPELIHDQTLAFIEQNKDRPFFAFVPSIIPHAELKVPDRYLERFRGKLEPEKAYKGCDPGCERYKNGGYGSQEATHATFAAMITLLDEQVGEIMAKVNELGLQERTIIIFTSDNGPHREGGADPDYFDSNGIYRGYKRDLYEGGIRVPMIAHWPGKIAAGQTNHLSAFWDVMPTVAELAGVDLNDPIDGISFLPTLMGKPQPKHDYLYWEFHERGGRRALRKDSWKLVQYNVGKQQKGAFQLYNLESDPGETRDLSGERPEMVRELVQLIESARTQSEVFTFMQD